MRKFEDIKYLAIEVTEDNYKDIFNHLKSLGYPSGDSFLKNIKLKIKDLIIYKEEPEPLIYILIYLGDLHIKYSEIYSFNMDLLISKEDFKSFNKSLIKKSEISTMESSWEYYRDVIEKYLLIENMGL